MKYRELFIMGEGLKDVEVAGANTDFLFAVAVNKRLLEPLITDLQDTIKADEKFMDFDTERRELIEEYSSKDDQGNPQIEKVNNETVVKIGDTKLFSEKNEELLAKYDKAIKAREKQLKNYNEHLETECDFKPKTVPYKSIPKKGLSQKAMDGLVFMIKN